MSTHYDFFPGSGPCFTALTPGDSFRFVNYDYSFTPFRRDNPCNEIALGPPDFKRNVVYTVISRRATDHPHYIGLFVLLWSGGLTHETLL